MEVIHAFMFGAFWLILAYLMFKNTSGVSAVFGGTKELTTANITALQGR